MENHFEDDREALFFAQIMLLSQAGLFETLANKLKNGADPSAVASLMLAATALMSEAGRVLLPLALPETSPRPVE